MADKLNVVTGATGLLGSHLAERLVARGERVRALVRRSSDASFLQRLGVELAVGDLGEPGSVRRAVEGADVVYHCAARVRDWGPWEAFQREVVEATAAVLRACREARVGRVLHVSSIIVYGHPEPRPGPFTEDEPLGQNLWRWDYYARAKIRAEQLCGEYEGDWTVVRPSWIYGPRDRNSFPRVLKALDVPWRARLGRGDNLLNIVYAADVAEGAILAANHPGARGRAYNLSSEGEITQREFLDCITDALGRRRVWLWVPYRTAFRYGFLSEVVGRALRFRRPPALTRYGVSLMGRPTLFSSARARTELGWSPRVRARDGLRSTLDWYLGTKGGGATPHEPAALAGGVPR